MLNIRNILFTIATLVTVNVSFGQKGSQSPYSSFGLGERNYDGYAVFSSTGGASLANIDSNIVNSTNPASYAYISRNLPVFQIGLNGKLSTFSTEANSTNQRHFGLNRLIRSIESRQFFMMNAPATNIDRFNRLNAIIRINKIITG